MTKLITVDLAKKEIKRLQEYVALVESYEAETLEKQIVKEYAITNSINKVSERLSIDRDVVIDVLKSLGKDELHKIVRTGYFHKVNSIRNGKRPRRY